MDEVPLYIWQVDLYVAHLLRGYENLTAPTPGRSSRGGPDHSPWRTGLSDEDLPHEDWGPLGGLGVPPLYQVRARRVSGVVGCCSPY